VWVVRVALNRPYTFVVVSLLILRRRMDASVLPVKAVGGGWNVAKLPKLWKAGKGARSIFVFQRARGWRASAVGPVALRSGLA